MINVTKTYLPSLKKYNKYLEKLWDNHWITNNGELLQELKNRLTEYLNVNNIVLVNNGTMALQIAYKLLNLKDDIITTPFTFIASSSSLSWEGLNPVFVDINEKTLNIDESLIENAISCNTTGILGVHVFGNPCDVESIDLICKKYNLSIIYDAAHAFGVEYKCKSILSYGDISTLSFHATKLFHTIEGGALIIKDDELYIKAKRMINFGYENWVIHNVGINAKMNEFQAAMGLCVLDDMDYIIGNRKKLFEKYSNELKEYVTFPKWNCHGTNNYSYFPVIFDTEFRATKALQLLNDNDIYPRRYFYPSLDTIQYFDSELNCRHSRKISSCILCLPFYCGLEDNIQDAVIDVIKKV